MLDQAARLFQSGQLDEARLHCIKALDALQGAARIQALNLLSVIELQQGQYDQAESTLKALIDLAPADAAAHYHLGLARQSQQQWSSAALSYQLAWQLGPEQHHYQINLIESLLQSQQWAKAGQVIETCLALRHHADGLMNMKIRVLCGQQDWQAVMNCLDSAIPSLSQSNDNQLCLLAARDCIAADRYADAARALERCPDIELSFEALVCRSVIMDRLDEPVQAIDDARAALAMKPDDYHANYNVAAVLSKRFDSESLIEADQCIGRALKVQPDSAEAWYTASLVYGKRMDFDAGLNAVNKALQYQPLYEDALIQSADILDRTDRVDESVKILKSAVKQLVDSAMLWRQLGIALLKQGEFDEACHTLKKACSMDQSDQRSIAHYILALAANGQADLASRLTNFSDNVSVMLLPVPPTYVSQQQFNTRLEADIRSHSSLRFEPIGLAARNGYLTEELRSDRTDAIQAFEQSLMSAIRQYINAREHDSRDLFLANKPKGDVTINLWATLVNGGGQIETHIHEDSWMSGAYYVRTGHAEGQSEELGASANSEGYLELGRPHTGMPTPEDQHIHLIRPVEGTLVLFPSFMFHRTIPDCNATDRISIAFDLRASREAD